MSEETRNWETITKNNMYWLVWSTSIILLLGMILSWLTWSWPKILKCGNDESIFNGGCYSNTISCDIQNGSWQKNREWDNYSECLVISCNEWFEKINNSCISEIRERSIIFSGDFISKDKNIWSYPKIKINSQIVSWSIDYTIDFTQEYKNTYSNYVEWKTSDGRDARSIFWLFFFLGDPLYASQSSYIYGRGGFFDSFSPNGTTLSNSNTLGLNGIVEWKDIAWWYTRNIPISKDIIVANLEPDRTENYQYKRVNILDFINNSQWGELYIWWYLSNAWIQWQEFTNIKEIKINYVWLSGAIEFVQ